MKRALALLIWMTSAATASADPSVAEMLRDASTCSDASLTDFAASTCESPEKIAAMAVAKCQSKWNAVADRAIGASPADASRDAAREHSRSLRVYSQAMEYEYIRVAELKAIEMRTSAGRCGFE